MDGVDAEDSKNAGVEVAQRAGIRFLVIDVRELSREDPLGGLSHHPFVERYPSSIDERNEVQTRRQEQTPGDQPLLYGRQTPGLEGCVHRGRQRIR